ncbi:hypothetical protein [Emticicia sp. W12TSBA100-4]|uniref:hypothetical protein n=1 Tax=Emticicia sp. W12TSBA100-4 TaxID=3160965 RepID=UPI0033068023
MKKTAPKQTNELRAVYDNAKKFYPQVATTWKKNCLTEAEYQSFMKIESYKDSDEVPLKYHKKIEQLRNLISNQARLVRELKTPQSDLFTNPKYIS